MAIDTGSHIILFIEGGVFGSPGQNIETNLGSKSKELFDFIRLNPVRLRGYIKELGGKAVYITGYYNGVIQLTPFNGDYIRLEHNVYTLMLVVPPPPMKECKLWYE